MPNILSFATNKEILAIMDRLINKHDASWQGFRAADLEAAKTKLSEHDIDVVLLGAGTDVAEREALELHCQSLGKTPKFVSHYGGGSGLLYAEVEQALVRSS